MTAYAHTWCTSCLAHSIVLERKLVTLLLRIMYTWRIRICRCRHHLNKRLMATVLIYWALIQKLETTHPLIIEPYKTIMFMMWFQHDTLLLEDSIARQFGFPWFWIYSDISPKFQYQSVPHCNKDLLLIELMTKLYFYITVASFKIDLYMPFSLRLLFK